MADVDYDDSLLQTSENLAKVDWDGIEGGGRLSPVNTPHLCLVKKVMGYLHNFESYTGPRAKILALVVEGADAGKIQHDDITLPHPQESDGSQKRRVLIGTRMGLIPKGSKESINVQWKLLEGRQVLLTVVHSKALDSDGKPYTNVTFGGWQDPAAAPAATGAAPAGAAASKDAYADI